MRRNENVSCIRLKFHYIFFSGYSIRFPDKIFEAFLIPPTHVTCSAQSDPFPLTACIAFMHNIYYEGNINGNSATQP